jgi:hypothetical protein
MKMLRPLSCSLSLLAVVAATATASVTPATSATTPVQIADADGVQHGSHAWELRTALPPGSWTLDRGIESGNPRRGNYHRSATASDGTACSIEYESGAFLRRAKPTLASYTRRGRSGALHWAAGAIHTAAGTPELVASAYRLAPPHLARGRDRWLELTIDVQAAPADAPGCQSMVSGMSLASTTRSATLVHR